MMTIMTKLRIGLGCAGLAFAMVFWAAEHFANEKLQAENNSLRKQVGEIGGLISENQRLSNQVSQGNNSLSEDQLSELLKLRSEVGFLRRQTNELRRAEAENRQLRARLAEQAPAAAEQQLSYAYLPKESWSFAGYDTPETALQSVWWAVSRGDAQTFLASLTPERLKQVQQNGVPDDKLATALAEEASKIKGYQITKTTTVTDDQMILDVSFDGEIRQVELAKVQGQWKLAKPISSVRSTSAEPGLEH